VVGERPVEVVDFPKDPLAANIQRAEVVFAMRVVVSIEAVESSDSLSHIPRNPVPSTPLATCLLLRFC